MTIGIDASRAFLARRTGIEEYAYQVIWHLRRELSDVSVRLYIRAGQQVDFDLPPTWEVRTLWAPRFWTQIRLSLELWLHPVETLFVPAHTIPLIHPARTVVVVHGLEYEFCPEAYSRWEYWYMRLSIRFSCRVASCIIAVSENTQRDLIRLYAVAAEKIQVVYEGYAQQASEGMESLEEKSSEPARVAKPYFLFIGRLETRKNILRIIEAFEKVKEKHALPHTLVLVGKPGYGYEAIASRRARSRYVGDILELGYVSEVEKWQLLREAEVFVFPTLYEGFGIPVLEAQALGVPVVTSNVSSLPEVAGEGALLVDPTDAEAIAQAMNLLASDIERKNAIIQRGRENVKRFSWETCAREIAEVMWREGK